MNTTVTPHRVIAAVGHFAVLRETIKMVLLQPFKFSWSLQGFGMLRLYLSEECRLHVWSTEHQVPNFSPIHDHPWAFISHVISGVMKNQRYERVDIDHYLGVDYMDADPTIAEYWSTVIKCGPGGGPVSQVPKPMWLRRKPMEVYTPGDRYSQAANELHESFPSDGAVSVIYRSFEADTEHATVAWKSGPWVSAEPRPATRDEIQAITSKALERWRS